MRLLAALVEPLACLSFQDPCLRHWCIALDENDNGERQGGKVKAEAPGAK